MLQNICITKAVLDAIEKVNNFKSKEILYT